MKVGQLTEVPVGDATFWVKLSWGAYKKLNRQLNKLDQNDTEAVLSFAEDNLVKLVSSCEGIEDEDGKPIKKLSAKVIDDLPPGFILELWHKIMAVGEELGGGGASPPSQPK